VFAVPFSYSPQTTDGRTTKGCSKSPHFLLNEDILR